MPKRKVATTLGGKAQCLTSFDAALDMLACETFTRLQHLSEKFEAAAQVKLQDGVVKSRWEEAVKRYWVMKSMDDLCCSSKKKTSTEDVSFTDFADATMEPDKEVNGKTAQRPLPEKSHPGVAVVHRLNEEEMLEWKRWQPKVGNVVLVELADDQGIWPGKIIDKKSFFQGRTVPRGNHFFPVRIYNDAIEPTVTIKSRLLPLHIRSDPPLLASECMLSAYNHANNPESFDIKAAAKESAQAHRRTHPGVGPDTDPVAIKQQKDSWNQLVNWVMSERRVEKLRALEEERTKRWREVAKTDYQTCVENGVSQESDSDSDMGRRRDKRSRPISIPPALLKYKAVKPGVGPKSIFGGGDIEDASTPPRTASPGPTLASLIRPAISTPQRPMSPRRLAERKRLVYSGVGERSPRGRGGTYTPPRILPSGDETAPGRNGSPVPTRKQFDFVSPLGPVKRGMLTASESIGQMNTGSSGLEPVKEEEGEGTVWTLVQNRKARRAGSAPCQETEHKIEIDAS